VGGAGRVEGGCAVVDFLAALAAARFRRGSDVVVTGLTAGVVVVVVACGGAVVLVVVVGALAVREDLLATWIGTEFLGSGTR
jgi:hypothetical protein